MIILRYNKETDSWQYFSNPLLEKKAYTYDEARDITAQIEVLCRDSSLYAIAVLSYEASPAFDPLYKVHPTSAPLAYVSYFDSFKTLTLEELYELSTESFSLSPSLFVSKEEYEKSFTDVKMNLRAGNTYQINLTFPFTASFDGNPVSWFIGKVKTNLTPYALYFENDDISVCSFSPELFFTRKKKGIQV